VKEFLKWPLRLAYIKFAIGVVIHIGLVVGYLNGTDRPNTFYVAIAASVLAVALWGRKILVLRAQSREETSGEQPGLR